MGSVVPDIGLDLKLYAAKTIKGFLNEAQQIEDGDGKSTKIEGLIKKLEIERSKIEVFQRELPLSTQLLSDMVEWLTEELEKCRKARTVFEEFMPMKSKFEEERGVKLEKNDCKDNKMNWMSSVQLWSHSCSKQSSNKLSDESTTGAFAPFKGGSSALKTVSKKEEKAAMALPDLSLLSSKGVSGVTASNSSLEGTQFTLQSQLQQTQRKTRRCWSPELHRRFVSALQQLGGAQVATPKQIRELMKVDGLTNDEVKSHLQKYRLHTRRVQNNSTCVSKQGNNTGSWINPKDQYTSSQQSTSQTESPQGPLQMSGNGRAISLTTGDSFEEQGEEDDERSESYEWK